MYIIYEVNSMQEKYLHSPRLTTILSVENTIKESERAISKAELKRRLVSGIMHQTLNTILDYLADSGKIVISPKGIVWTYIESPKLREILNNATQLR